MTILRLFIEFFCTGLFSVGGGLATVPFLQDMGLRTGWFDSADLGNMIAVSESTPGALGVNMATYVGFTVAGIPGCIIATLGLIAPSVVIILLIAGILQKYRHNSLVEGAFYGLRPASVALISAAGLELMRDSLLILDNWTGFGTSGFFQIFNWQAIIIFVVVFVLYWFSPLKKLHPIVFVAFSAVFGIIFQM